MPRPQRKSFADPDEVRTFKRGHIDVVLLDEIAIAALAGPGDVLVSGTTHELLDGSGLSLEPRGKFELKGLSGARTVFALRRVPLEA